MATKYRTESEPVTISIDLDIPEWVMPVGVDPVKAKTIKISGLPVTLRCLLADLSVKQKFVRALKTELCSTRLEPIKKIKAIAPLPEHLQLNINAMSGVEEYIYREERERLGKFHRGKKAKDTKLTDEVKTVARWLHALFRYYKSYIPSNRPTQVKAIYDARSKAFKNKRTKDPNLMVHFCCEVLFADRFTASGRVFPSPERLRTNYLKGAAQFRPLSGLTCEEVVNCMQDPDHPLHICSFLQI